MSAVSPVSLFLADQPQSDCPNCGFLAWCLPAELELRDLQRFNKLVTHQRLIKREGIVYRAGSALGSLYVVCSGFLKTTLPHDDGRDHVTGFSMTGELIGVDAIGAGKHTCNTIALEDSRVCGIRYADFEELGHAIPKLQHRFHQAMSAEIARDHEAMFLLGSARANERVAIFLLDLSK
jgi:CRP/FNR family transcriptional regulator, anaerobic regulatory protein